MKDPLGMLVGLTGEYNLLRSVLVMILDGVLFLRPYWGFLGGVLLIGENFPPLGKTVFFFLVTYWGLMLIPL